MEVTGFGKQRDWRELVFTPAGEGTPRIPPAPCHQCEPLQAQLALACTVRGWQEPSRPLYFGGQDGTRGSRGRPPSPLQPAAARWQPGGSPVVAQCGSAPAPHQWTSASQCGTRGLPRCCGAADLVSAAAMTGVKLLSDFSLLFFLSKQSVSRRSADLSTE